MAEAVDNSQSESYNSQEAFAALISEKHPLDRFYLKKDVNILGRHRESVVFFQDAVISRKHCVISKTGDNKFTICDTSVTGTFLNRKRLPKNCGVTLRHKDILSFASVYSTSYVFLVNKLMNSSVNKEECLNFQMPEQIINLDNSHVEEINKLDQVMNTILAEKSDLQDELSSRLIAQTECLNEEKLSLSNLIAYSQSERDNAEQKLKQMELHFKAEKRALMDEVATKLTDIAKREEEVQNLKYDLEQEYRHARHKLSEKCRGEIEELKIKVAMAEKEQTRLLEETKEAQKKLAESNEILKDCEIEQSRLADEKTEFESKLMSVTKENVNKVRELEDKLSETEKERIRVKKEMEGLEEHLSCSICVELFIEPTVITCGHMFCKTCIEEWKQKNNICPLCRKLITGVIQVYNLDTIIEKNMAIMSSEAIEHRQKVIEARKASSGSHKGKEKRKRKRKRVSVVPPYQMNHANLPLPLARPPPGMQGPPLMMIDEMREDTFTWRNPIAPRFLSSNRQGSSGNVSEEAIDLTNVFEAIPPRTRSTRATATTTSGMIDLTTP